MMTSIRNWYIKHQDAITWSLIGFLIADGLNSLARGNIGMAALSFIIALLNFLMYKHRL
jgi:hypothetical protein